MAIHFNKMQGAGNSYIYITSTTNHLDQQAIVHMCHPHYGIGGDGVVLLCPSDSADVAMVMYNKDGTRGAMCGNALRCVAKLLYHHHPQQSYHIQCDCGIVAVDTIDNTHYTVHMPDVAILDCIDIDDCPITQLTTVHCGNQHAVSISNLTAQQLSQYMPMLDNQYLHGKYNVELAQIRDRQNVHVVVYERGSGITLSCGSGAVATMALLHSLQLVDDTCHIHMQGGTLTVQHTANGYTLTGEAIAVFAGDIL